jgi:hypothetical protein
MMNKEKVVVSRAWKNPEIKVFASTKEVGAEMDIEVFLRTLVEEMGNPTLLVTKQQLLSKLLLAKDAVVNEMKKATIHV